MSILVANNARTRGSSDVREWLRRRMGFPPAAIPVVVLFGAIYLMLTMPAIFEILSRIRFIPGYAQDALALIWEQAQRWESQARVLSYSGAGIWLTRLSMLAIPALWIAALIRSAVVKSWRPFVITASASLLGAIGIPIAAWTGELVVVVWRALDVIVRFFATWILPWILRIGFWLVIAAVAAASLYAIYSFVAYLVRSGRWVTFLISLVVVGAVVGAIWLWWLDPIVEFLRWLAIWIERIVAWVANLLSPIIVWILRALFAVTIFVAVVGLAIAFFGELGRQFFLPLRSATGAGNDSSRCADLAAGVGVAMSLALTAAVLDPGFGGWFGAIWRDTPLIGGAPVPIDAYGVLLPSAAEDLLGPVFAGYLPIVDVAILVLAAAMGVLSLLFASANWQPGPGSRVVRPVLFAVGGAIAVAVVFLFLMLVGFMFGKMIGGT